MHISRHYHDMILAYHMQNILWLFFQVQHYLYIYYFRLHPYQGHVAFSCSFEAVSIACLRGSILKNVPQGIESKRSGIPQVDVKPLLSSSSRFDTLRIPIGRRITMPKSMQVPYLLAAGYKKLNDLEISRIAYT